MATDAARADDPVPGLADVDAGDPAAVLHVGDVDADADDRRDPAPVLRLGDVDTGEVQALLARYGLELVETPAAEPIPGSYWGDDEAGLIADRLYARADTPLHSVLHEASHYVCVSPERRAALDTEAGSDEAEENAVCYLQLLLADHLPAFGFARACADMDAWGYSFRLGSTRAWFTRDADDARQWLLTHALITDANHPTWHPRT